MNHPNGPHSERNDPSLGAILQRLLRVGCSGLQQPPSLSPSVTAPAQKAMVEDQAPLSESTYSPVLDGAQMPGVCRSPAREGPWLLGAADLLLCCAYFSGEHTGSYSYRAGPPLTMRKPHGHSSSFLGKGAIQPCLSGIEKCLKLGCPNPVLEAGRL